MRLGKLITLLFLVAIISISHANSTPNVWDVLRDQLTLDHQLNQPEVQSQIRWLVNHPDYLAELTESKPYIYHIVTQIRKRHLPGELALIPMLESTYDPFAYSGAGAAGLWQLMPETGNDLGLKRDWWYDGRRSIGPSTDAALNYLAYLNKFFHGDWLLAIAAYDSGEGTVAKAIRNSGQSRRVNFWKLPVPRETKAYVPRLLALAEIIKYPQRYKVNLPYIPHVPYFEEVNIGSQIDLNHAAKLAGISYKDLIKLNPGYNRWATAPYKPFKLLIPANKVEHFNHNLSTIAPEKRVSWSRHQVKRGESLSSIANHYFTTPKLIRELNQLKSDRLANGQYILIPSTKNTTVIAKSKPTPDFPASTQTYKVVHIVQAGENMKTIEQKYHVSAQKIQTWNKLKSTQLAKGSELIIWRNTVKPGIYTVIRGDSLGKIAQLNKTTVARLEKLNPGLRKTLKPGQRITIG